MAKQDRHQQKRRRSAKNPPHRRKSNGVKKGIKPIQAALKSSMRVARVEGQRDRHKSFPIVGIGASAGGLEAFTQLLHHLPTNTGMAFVLVQHLDPTHESILPQLLSRATSMPVATIRNGMIVNPDHIYVIPPNRNMAIKQGVLKLLPASDSHGSHHSIDYFLQSLAEDQSNQAIGVILSGTASDGTIGLETIKAEGGITFVQEEKSAKYDSMPHSAIVAGCADFVLPPEGIAKEIGRISRHPHVTPAEPTTSEMVLPEGKDELKRIMGLLHRITGADFTVYRSNTIQRRITRRMLLSNRESLLDYFNYLRERPEEVQALFQDFLIGVTSFFRKPESFDYLKKKIFPSIMKRRIPDEPLRIWVPGCSTGQEAYSIAMAFLEYANDSVTHPLLQIFATDLNESSIDKARIAVYPKNALHEVSRERLRHFFLEVQGQGGFRINKTVRDMCVFAKQDILTDPPFSQMDVISCRNLLIYLEPAIQNKLVPLFHYALKPGGFLWLGASESVGTSAHMFAIEDKKYKFYSKKPSIPRPQFPFAHMRKAGQKAVFNKVTEPLNQAAGSEFDAQKEADRLLLAKYAPAGVLINAGMEILQFRGNTGPYLEPAPGKASFNLLKMLREDLLLPVRAAIQKAKRKNHPVRTDGIRVSQVGSTRVVRIEVIPIQYLGKERPYFLVLFEPGIPAVIADVQPPPAVVKLSRSQSIQAKRADKIEETTRLRKELAATREYLQSIIEEHEAASEELQASSEEVQSSNEELQSTNEELETSKEELQATNEELITVNDELLHRNREINQLIEDLTNLLNSVNFPILMVDSKLRIRRLTSIAESTLNIRATDVGRPLSDIKLKIDLPDWEHSVSEAMGSTSVREQEVQDRQGRWYSLRVLPYKTMDNRIDGAVITLFDVDILKHSEQQMKEARQYAEAIVDTVKEGLVIIDGKLRVQSANKAFYQKFQLSPVVVENRLFYELGNGQWNIPKLRSMLEDVVSEKNSFSDFEADLEFEGIGSRTVLLNARRIFWQHDTPELILLAIEDITERKQLALAQAARAEAEAANRAKDEFLAMISHELRTPLNTVIGWSSMLRSGELDKETFAHGVETIERNTKSLAQLVGDLLDVARITSGKLRMNIESVNLSAVINKAIQSVKLAADSKGIQIETILDSKIEPISGDPERLEQIVLNLLSNAVKYTPQGGQVQVQLAQKGDAQVEIVVRDTGEGINPAFLPHVFDPFLQADSSSTRKHGGLGLGLAIANHLVRLHGGTIRVESKGEGEGTTFTITLPIPPTKDAISDWQK